jgi:2-iminobutanoate/2-iminopropanoate deaminase
MRKVISTDNSPKAIGTYSQGIQIDNLVFTSGQIPLHPETGKLVQNDFKSEVNQVMLNLKGVLEEAGSSLKSIVKCTVFLTDLTLFPQLNEVFSEYFISEPPARSAVEVSALPLGVRVEIEAIALKNNDN